MGTQIWVSDEKWGKIQWKTITISKILVDWHFSKVKVHPKAL